jgi:hypothetical protein
VLRLRQRDGYPQAGEFRVPGGPVIPMLGFLLIAWLLWQLTLEEAYVLGALTGAAILYYVISNHLTRKQVAGARRPAVDAAQK